MKSLTRNVSGLLLAAAGFIFPITLAAQGAGAAQTPGRPTTDQQMSGEAVFYQNCTFCHEHDAQKKRLVPQFLGPPLFGLYKGASVSDEAVRALILKGIPKRMTGFQYTLTPKETDDLIAYLKVR